MADRAHSEPAAPADGEWRRLTERLVEQFAPIELALEHVKTERTAEAVASHPLRAYIDNTNYLLTYARMFGEQPDASLTTAWRHRYELHRQRLPQVLDAVMLDPELNATQATELSTRIEMMALDVEALHRQTLRQAPAPRRSACAGFDRTPLRDFDKPAWAARTEALKSVWDKVYEDTARYKKYAPETVEHLKDLFGNLLQAMGALQRVPIAGALPSLQRSSDQADGWFAQAAQAVAHLPLKPQRQDMQRHLDDLHVALREVYSAGHALEAAQPAPTAERGI